MWSLIKQNNRENPNSRLEDLGRATYKDMVSMPLEHEERPNFINETTSLG